MRKPQPTSASSREAQAAGTRIVTLPPPPAPVAAATAVEERRLVAPRRRPDPLPPPVGEGGELATALDRHRRGAVTPPVGQVVGAAVAEDLGAHPASDQGGDHATDPPLLDGAKVAVAH
jgi:hypothetical protein